MENCAYVLNEWSPMNKKHACWIVLEKFQRLLVNGTFLFFQFFQIFSRIFCNFFSFKNQLWILIKHFKHSEFYGCFEYNVGRAASVTNILISRQRLKFYQYFSYFAKTSTFVLHWTTFPIFATMENRNNMQENSFMKSIKFDMALK